MTAPPNVPRPPVPTAPPPRARAVTLHLVLAGLFALGVVGAAWFAVDGAVTESAEGYRVPVDPFGDPVIGPDGVPEEMTFHTVHPTVAEGLALRSPPLLWALCGAAFFVVAAACVRRGRLIVPLRRLYAGAAVAAGLAALGLLLVGFLFATSGGWGVLGALVLSLYAAAAAAIGSVGLLLSRSLREPTATAPVGS